MNLYFKETGKTQSETIIFLHEFNMAGWMWDRQVEALPDYHCITPDLPEHGKSKDASPFTMEKAADQVIELIEQKTEEGKVHLVGVALGAQVALKILSKSSDLVDRVFISGTLANSTPPTESFIKLLDYLLKVYIPVKDDHLSIGSYIRCYNIPRSQIRNFRESTKIIKPESTYNILKENVLFEMPSNMENISNSVLIMAGEKDYDVIKRCVKEIDDMLPNSQAYLAPGVGHIWNIEAPELFNQTLRSWINKNPLPKDLNRV